MRMMLFNIRQYIFHAIIYGLIFSIFLILPIIFYPSVITNSPDDTYSFLLFLTLPIKFMFFALLPVSGILAYLSFKHNTKEGIINFNLSKPVSKGYIYRSVIFSFFFLYSVFMLLPLASIYLTSFIKFSYLLDWTLAFQSFFNIFISYYCLSLVFISLSFLISAIASKNRFIAPIVIIASFLFIAFLNIFSDTLLFLNNISYFFMFDFMIPLYILKNGFPLYFAVYMLSEALLLLGFASLIFRKKDFIK